MKEKRTQRPLIKRFFDSEWTPVVFGVLNVIFLLFGLMTEAPVRNVVVSVAGLILSVVWWMCNVMIYQRRKGEEVIRRHREALENRRKMNLVVKGTKDGAP